MDKRIIDLREPPPELPEVQLVRPATDVAATRRQGTAGTGTTGTGSMLSNDAQFRQRVIEWTALEYPSVERGQYWWMPPFVVALACILFAVLVKSYLFGGFTALSLVVVLLYMKRPPRAYRFAISREGVYIGEQCHRWAELKSFCIFEHEHHPELSIETTTGRFFPYLYLPLGDTHPNRIRRALSDFLPEQEHQESFTDQIARSIGF